MIYKTLYEKNAKLYKRKNAKQALELANNLLTWFFIIAYGALWLHFLDDKTYTALDVVRITLPLAMSILTVMVLRLGIDRARPYSEEGAGITPVLKRKKTDRNSCPSRHLACAATIAMLCLRYSTAEGVLLLFAMQAFGYVRFSAGYHYISDLLIGAGIGLTFGLLPFFI